jgi:ABC-type Zn uptake system ZnuABC Zn-binding protein ZnuA
MACVALILMGLVATSGRAEDERPLRVCATVPELGSLAREIGGDHSHFVEPRPSFIKALSQADLFVQVGLELEVGWVPVLVLSARNERVLVGAPGYVDASTAIVPLDVPSVSVDRSMGDVHPQGNPHYLLDPLNGLSVARLMRDKLGELRPSKRAFFDARYDAFRKKLGVALVGEPLTEKYEFEKLALLFEHGKLGDFLEAQGEAALLGGWLGSMSPHFGVKAAGDHNLWPYFARRFGLRMVGFLEPKPGVPPTTKHVAWLIEHMRAEHAKLILSAAYYDPRHARFVSEHTGAAVVRIAHQAGAREGTDTYMEMLDHNLRALAAALGSRQ